MIHLPVRYVHAMTQLRTYRKQLLHQHRRMSALQQENQRLRAALDAETSQLRDLLAASPVEAKQLAVKWHDRLLGLTHANATARCVVCRRRSIDGRPLTKTG